MLEPASKVRKLEIDLAVPRLCRPTLRGLTTGTVRINATSIREPAILWCDDFCSWLGVLEELHLRPVAVVMTSTLCMDLVRASVGGDCFVGLESDFTVTIAESLRGRCKLGLVDGRITVKTCALASKLALERILGTKPLRRPIGGWSQAVWTLRHCDQGGVTTRLTAGCCLHPGVSSISWESSAVSVPRDASTVLDPRAPSHKYRPAPPSCVVMPLGCLNLGVDAKPYFHGGGLLPGDLDRRTEVLTPGIYAKKGDWALRRLTLEEVLVAKDYGKVLTGLLSAGTLSNALLRNLTPGKTLVALARRWGCNGGG
jgi:hypothetical protein